MPGAAVTAFFLDNEDWSPVGAAIVVAHELIVRSGVDLQVRRGIIVEVRSGIDIDLDSGNDLEE
jgi:hypothetical protein